MAALDGPAPSQSCPPASGASMKPVNTTSFSASDASGPERGSRRRPLGRPPTPAVAPARPIRVAILDDHPSWRWELTWKCARASGSCTRKRRRGACWKAGRLARDVALIDFYLPQEPWDGVNYLRRLKRYHPTMALITFSAGNRHETQYAAFRGGASGYLAKQWGMVLLPDMIRGVLSGKDAFLSVQDGKIRAIRPTPRAADDLRSRDPAPYQPGPVGDADRGPPDAQQEDHQHAQAPRDAQARALGRSIPGPVPAREVRRMRQAGAPAPQMMRE